MFRKPVSLIILFLLVANSLALAYNVEPINVKARLGAEYTQAESIDWWPMFHHDSAHTGYSTSTAPTTNHVLWSYTTGDAVESSPAVAGGVVYICPDDGKIYALNAETGAYIWSYALGIVWSSPAVAGGIVYVGSDDWNVYALDAATGAEIWKYTTGWVVYSSPVVAGDIVYVGSYDSEIYALNALTGVQVWNFTTGSTAGMFVSSSPAVGGGMVYVGTSDNNIYALNALTGVQVWNFTTGDAVESSAAFAGGRVYVGSDDGNIYCLSASTGDKIWSYATGDIVRSSPAVADGIVYVGSWDGKVYALNAATGAYIWSQTVGKYVDSSPAVAGGIVYVGSMTTPRGSIDNNVCALNALTGALVWGYTTGWFVRSSPAIADGKIYVGSADGKVYCFGSSTSSTFVVTFTESGLAQGTQWSIDFNGKTYSSTSNQIILKEPNGVYPFHLTTFLPTGYTASPLSGNAIVSGAGATEQITFAPPESVKGINSSITGVTSLTLLSSETKFTIQQNFYVANGFQDSDGIHPQVYWCQNVVELNTAPGSRQFASIWIWLYQWSTGGKVLVAYTPPGELSSNSISDKIEFDSELGYHTLVMSNSIGGTTFDNVLGGNAYIFTSGYSLATPFGLPNLVVVGPASAGQADFVGGRGQVSCGAMVAGKWIAALNLDPVGNGAATGETSTGLAWPTNTQGHPTGEFYYQSGLPLYNEGVFFEPDFSSTTTRSRIAITAHCPVYLDLYDGLGNCVGYNATSGAVENQIETAVWVSNQTILVFDPSGIYCVEVTGRDKGTYELETSWQDVTGITLGILDVNSTIMENETQNYAIGDSANVTLTSILPSKTVVFQGYDLQVNASVADLGGPDAIFNATLYANGTAIGKQNMLNVSGWNSANVCFTCNTTGLAPGNYTLSADVQPTNSNFTGGSISVSMIGDLNGGGPTIWDFIPDGKCNILDVSAVAKCFGSYPGCSPPLIWNVNCDATGLTFGVPDDKVNILDVALVARHFGEPHP